MPVAIVTGASRGLGLALTRALADRGWRVVVDARDGAELRRATAPAARAGRVVALPGDVTDPGHRRALVAAAGERIDLLVNNAGALGPTPRPGLAAFPPAALEELLRVNVVAPLALAQLVLPRMPAGAVVLNVTSDAAVEPYAGWGGYGASKAALDQLTAILGAEHPGLRVLAVDPGDLRTRLHQDAFPGEDISDRPPPEVAVPGLLGLVEGDAPSGRHRAADAVPAATAVADATTAAEVAVAALAAARTTP